MKCETGFKKLKDAVLLIERIAGKHQTLPVLSCILFEIKKNTLILKSTNLDVGVEVSIPIKSDSEGFVAIPAKTLASFLSQVESNNQLVTIEIVSGNLHIKAGTSKGVIKTVPTEDFPTIPKIQDGESCSIDPHLFIDGISAVAYSASVSTVKPELASVYIYKNGDQLYFVSTDSFRLAEKKTLIPKGVTFNDILIPSKNIQDIAKILGGFSSPMVVKTNKNLISFEQGDMYLVSRIIDGVFPDYRQIIPKTSTTEVVALKQDILTALKISNIFSDKFNLIHLTIDPKAKLFEIQTKNSDVGENETKVDAAITGERIEINFNYRYLSEGFQSIFADSVSLQLNGLNRPVIIKPVSGDQSFLYLVMPMNR